jgi:hypothetical protein
MSDASLLRSARGGPVALLLALALVVACLLAPPPASAQTTARVTSEENLRDAPNGEILGQLNVGTTLEVLRGEGNWSQVTLEGYVWERSMQIDRREGFGLVISEPGGENLRDAPSGRIAARLARGTLLEELERVPGWVRVRRTAWIWTPSIESTGPVAAPPAGELPARAGADPAVEVVTGTGTGEWLTPGRSGMWLLTTPDGDSLARAEPGAELRVLARQGNWARVRVEGWVWTSGAEQADVEVVGAAGEVLRDVTVQQIQAEPDRYRGRRLLLELQFISLERAEAVRTDFYEGEPFLLMRTRTPDRTFVYVAIPPERVGEFERLTPLEVLAVTGRVRRPDAAFTGSPILDLLEFRRVR